MNTKSRLKRLFQFYRKQFIKLMQDNIKFNCTNQIPTYILLLQKVLKQNTTTKYLKPS